MDKFAEEQINIIRNNVKTERIRCGYTQSDLAKILEISKSAYSKLEQGQRTFSLEHLIAISNFLNVELPSLLRMQVSKEDILNQTEEKRKQFLKELLLTFGIGAKPQKEYSMREMSALITFIRAYGHSLPYTPNRLKNHLFYTGKMSSAITASIEEIISVYENGLPEKYNEVRELLKQEFLLKNKLVLLQQQINDFEEMKVNETTPKLHSLESEIHTKKRELSTINSQIISQKSKLSNLVEEARKLERTISLHKSAVDAIEQSKKAEPSQEKVVSYDSELLQKYEQLILEKEALLKELDVAYEEIDRLEDNTTQAEIENDIQDGIDDYISENYHNFSGEEFEMLVDNLLFFAQIYANIRRKYKSVSDTPYIYAKATIDRDYLEYADLTDISSVLKIVDDALDWERDYGTGI